MPVHPALNLAISIVLAVHLTIPLGTWIMLSGRRDDKTRLWFIGTTLFSLSMCGIAVRPYVSEFWAHVMPWTMACTAWLMMIETFRRELQLPAQHAGKLLLALGLWMGVLLWVLDQGRILTWGVLCYTVVFLSLNLYLLRLLFRLGQRHPSQSIDLMKMAMALYAATFANRLYQYAVRGDDALLDVFSFSWVGNILVCAAILAIILLCFGYWGFTLEKSAREKQAAEASQKQAELESEAMRQLVKERDQLLMLNARVSALSNLSSFSAMLVHDISQPLQALELGLYGLQGQLAQTAGDTNALQQHVQQLLTFSGKAGDMITSLRQLMMRGQDQVTSVDPAAVIRSILPILQSEAEHRHVQLDYTNHLRTGLRVQANAVMLQRMVFNLLANALDALRLAPHHKGHIQIDLLHSPETPSDMVILQIQDNGPGLPEALLQQLTGPVESSKADGMGLNLLLTQSMLRLWGGQARMQNLQGLQGPGAVIALHLAVTQPTPSNPS